MASFWKTTNENDRIPCPNCGAPLLSNMKECPKCHYSLVSRSVSPEAQRRIDDQRYVQNADSQFIICTTSKPEGYVINQERGIVSGDSLFSNATAESIHAARNNALNALKAEAIKKQCNAAIGVRIETCLLGANFCVTAYGTAARVIKAE